MRVLTWGEFDAAVASLALQMGKRRVSGVYGFPRGGLPLAVALSHKLQIPLLQLPCQSCLVVDDAYETGATLNQVQRMPNVVSMVWISKAEPTWWKAAEVVTSQEWVVFPWENLAAAQADEESYRASRQ